MQEHEEDLRRLLGDEGARDELGLNRGRKAELRGEYLEGHDQLDTHLSRFRVLPVVNVLLGDRMPRPDRTPGEKDRWCRAMLILFKPWRLLEDLKHRGQSWTAAFNEMTFSDKAKETMLNMNVENECKDAKDKYEALRKAGKVKPLLPGHSGATASSDIESLTNALHRDAAL
ncbi:hypothetical protein B0H16DRAFT_1324164, partial [Mycena metata]